MKIGLYFGSFNPIHMGHLVIASHVANYADVQQVWFVVSPQNPLKSSTSLLNEHQRLFLVQKAIENDNRFKACDVEFKLPKPSYSIDTLTYLSEKHPEHEFLIIIGSDSLQNIKQWKNYKELLTNYKLIVYERPGFEVNQIIDEADLCILKNAPLLNISATLIRENIRTGKNINYLVLAIVKDEIEKGGYYK
ncbi:MAG: nicotinate-nucleotide adenylyltransferase [Bacteroidetes bacterium]|nr:nicotinate-nucleotide adenylyltransferase [Bacteroidota bacterium]MBS1649168.1 nicotinate-nucleotide adenylyltransferase [Bacteroidota bacterium]